MTGIKIASNSISLSAQRRLAEATSSLERTFERLSSGQRINRASDDAAGLAIASSLTVKNQVYGQAIRNINDGISVHSIADTTVEALTQIATRMKELATQSANGTYSVTQRQALDQEAQTLAKEYFRVSRTASFNGQSLFDGSLADGMRLQLGFGVDGSINTKLGGELGTGEFTISKETELDIVSNWAEALGDLNGDGLLDLVATGSEGATGTGFAVVQLGQGGGTLEPSAEYACHEFSTYDVALEDLNGDGALDLVTVGWAFDPEREADGGFATVRLGKGDGTFLAAFSYLNDSFETYALSLGDLNGDGVSDLVTTGYGSGGTTTIRLGRGDGTFGTAVQYSSLTSQFTGLALGDLNGDGQLDLALADYVESELSIRLGRGDGTFGAEVRTPTLAAANTVLMEDFNSDSSLDLVIRSGSGVEVRLGRGDGSFDSATGYANGSHALSIADLNGDGVLDLVGVGADFDGDGTGASLTTFLGRGDGSFVVNTSLLYGVHGVREEARAVVIGDMDGDGVSDLVVATEIGEYSTRTSVLLGNTRDGISPIQPFSLKTKAEALQALSLFGNALNNLASMRGTIGANQSRLQTALTGIQTSKENYLAAGSRITDSDVAQESATLVRTQILQQAASGVLAQANQAPQLALMLLR